MIDLYHSESLKDTQTNIQTSLKDTKIYIQTVIFTDPGSLITVHIIQTTLVPG